MDLPTQPSRGVAGPAVPQLERRYQPGDILAGKFRLTHRLASGGMGTIWGGQNVPLELPVAIKMFHSEQASNLAPSYLGQCLFREARAMAAVQHSAIARVYDFGFTEWDDPYIAMELLEGETLGHLMGKRGALPPERALQLMLPIADALVCAHRLGVVHCDLKPENIFLAATDNHRLQPKLLDFGIARLAWVSESPRTVEDEPLILGTPAYMAPEQATHGPIDARADIWAFSVILYEMLAGELPFPAQSLPETLCAVSFREAPPLANLVGTELWSLIERGLRKKREERWGSMAELGAALSRWLMARGITEDVAGASLAARWSMYGEAPPFPRSSGPSAKPRRPRSAVRARVISERVRRHRPSALMRGSVAAVAAAWLVLAPAAPSFGLREAMSDANPPAGRGEFEMTGQPPCPDGGLARKHRDACDKAAATATNLTREGESGAEFPAQ
jgi:serine/threonine protein kinase